MSESCTALAVQELPSTQRRVNQYPPDITKQKQKEFLLEVEKTGQVRQSCVRVGIAPNTPYQWAIKSTDFAKRFDQAKERGEKILLDLYEETIDKRVSMGPYDPQSAVLTMFRTKRLDPRYRDNAPAHLTVMGPLNIAMVIEAPASQVLDVQASHAPQVGVRPKWKARNGKKSQKRGGGGGAEAPPVV